jgi:hypothetical protein
MQRSRLRGHFQQEFLAIARAMRFSNISRSTRINPLSTIAYAALRAGSRDNQNYQKHQN